MPRRNVNAEAIRWPTSPAFDDQIAASLHNLTREVRQAAWEQQETPPLGRDEVSTAPNLLATDRRAATAHHDRGF